MALDTHSKFLFGWKITTANRNIDFNDGAVKAAVLKVGTYSPAALAVEIALKMNAASSLVFTVSFSNSTRMFTIASTGPFSLLFSTGTSAGQSPASLLGFTTLDKTAASTYTSESASGSQYTTQFCIQSYKPTSQNRQAISGVVNKSASGVIEVIKFGDERFMSGELLFVTDIQQAVGSIIRTNGAGVSDYITFIEWCTEKGPVLFFEDENNVLNYQSLQLESTEQDPQGLDYELIELYDRGLAEYFRSGVLKFRLI